MHPPLLRKGKVTAIRAPDLAHALRAQFAFTLDDDMEAIVPVVLLPND